MQHFLLCVHRVESSNRKENGCPPEGPLFEEKGRLRAVKRRVRYCAAQAENRRMLRRHKMFASGNRGRFRLPLKKRNTCSRMVVGEKVIDDPHLLMDAWCSNFENLAKSRAKDCSQLSDVQSQMETLASMSQENEHLLDVPFSTKEVERAVRKLKRKLPGPDNLLAEHLLEGHTVVTWLTGVLNAIIELEIIPDSLKRGLEVPVYKGSGKDPSKMDSYRGVTLSTVIAKVLEILILDRLDLVFLKLMCLISISQPYRKNVSCASMIFRRPSIMLSILFF